MFYEHLAWFTVLWVSVLVARHLWRAAHQPVPASVSSPKRKTPRPLKPRTPHDCPVCGRPHPTPLWGNPRQAGAPAASRGVNEKVRGAGARRFARRGKQTPRRYGPRTPAMAAGLTDHLWSVEELLAFPVGQ